MEKAIPLKDADQARRLTGVYDVNLRRLRELTRAEIVIRDGAVKVRGPKPRAERAARVVRALLRRLESQEQITEEEVVEAAGGGEAERPAPRPAPGTIFRRDAACAPKSEGQERYLALIDANDIVLAIGPAGTGKTFLAVARAVDALRAGRVRRLVLVRPAVEAGERLGFLPGDIQAKVSPYLRPIYDSLNTFLEFGQLQRLIDSDVVEIVPLAYMRGRTLDEAFIILDEAQNTTGDQMKMFLTRMGARSKIVVTGDVTQIDLPAGVRSGLVEAEALLRNIPGIGVAVLSKLDIVRHPLVQRIVEAYGEKDDRNR
jgi:phosphate starvation-inducible PhoH-like protein